MITIALAFIQAKYNITFELLYLGSLLADVEIIKSITSMFK